MTLTHYFSLESVHFNYFIWIFDLIFHLKRKNNKLLWSFTYLHLKWIESIKQTRIHIIQSLSDSLCAALTIETYSDLIVPLIDMILSWNNDSKDLAYNSSVDYFCSLNRQNVDRLMSNCIFGQRNIISNIF